MRIDLHTHSTASDGTDSPTQLIQTAAAQGLDVVALTDHDSTAGWAEATHEALRLGVSLVPGVEISCNRDGVSAHVLSYLHDPMAPGLLAEFERTRNERLTRAQRMVERLGRDFSLTWQDVVANTPEGATVGRPHIADAMVRLGLVADRDEAFADVLHSSSPYHVRHYAPDPVLAVELVRQAGGVPVLAHPRARTRGRVLPSAVIDELAQAGLVGLEVEHRDHTEQDRAELRRLAADLGLLTTGSSDYHGLGKRNRMGECTTDAATLAHIVELGSGSSVVRP